mgnify:CR=1 FL=1
MRIIIINFLILLLLLSCERKCNLKPIPKNIFDVEKIKPESVILESGKNIDSLTFNDKYDSYIENSFKGPMKYEECGHHKSYTYNFRNETIQVCLDKNDKEIFELSLIGWFNKFNDIRTIKENELLLNKQYIFERETDCDSSKSQIKRVVLNGYVIKYIITIDNKKWQLK